MNQNRRVSKAQPGARLGEKPLRVGIVVASQFTLNALANFIDVLRLSSDEGDRSRPVRCRWHLMAATDAPIRASCGVQLMPTATLLDFTELDYVAVIGGLLHRGRQVDEGIRSYLIAANKAGIPLIGICTGSFVLCRLGLMRGKKCCISWYHYRDFMEEFDDMVPVADEVYVVDGNRITSSGGIGSALTAAHLVSRHLDAASAQKALHIMQIENARSNAAIQPAPPMEWACDEERVKRSLLTMEQNIHTPIAIEDLAARLLISKRNLERLFSRHLSVSPAAVYLSLRLKHARWMLQSSRSLACIAVDTGFASSSHFCAAFKRMYGKTPSEERRRFELPSKLGAWLMPERSGRVFDLA